MSTSAALAASANANAAIAAEQAAAAHRAACSAMMPTFNGATATPELARVYARCVDLMYPTSDPMVWRIVVACGLLGMVIGALWPVVDNWRSNRKNPRYAEKVRAEVVAFGGFVGMLATSVAMLIVAGVWFVISGVTA